MNVVGETLRRTVWVDDTHHLTIRLMLQRRALIQHIDHRHQVLAFVIAIPGAIARTVLEALHLSPSVPLQVLGLVRRIDDGVRQVILAVEILRHLPRRVELGKQVVPVIVARLPGAAVGELTWVTSVVRWWYS